MWDVRHFQALLKTTDHDHTNLKQKCTKVNFSSLKGPETVASLQVGRQSQLKCPGVRVGWGWGGVRAPM